LYFLSTDEQTPVEHRPRLHALSRIFETKNTVPIPDRQALKNALKKDCSIGVTRIPITAQKIQSLKKQKKNLKNKKIMKGAYKNRKLKKFGIKINKNKGKSIIKSIV